MIHVFGNCSIDVLQFPGYSDDGARELGTIRVEHCHGGAWLVAQILEVLGSPADCLPKKPEIEALASLANGKEFPTYWSLLSYYARAAASVKKGDRVFRISRSYVGAPTPEQDGLNVADVGNDDIALFFFRGEQFLPKSLALNPLATKPRFAIFQFHDFLPDDTSPIWSFVNPDLRQQTVFVFHVPRLRQIGAEIRDLSWDQACLTFRRWLHGRQPGYDEVKSVGHLVVRFGNEAAILASRVGSPGDGWSIRFFFRPFCEERGFANRFGRIAGYTSLYSAAIAAALEAHKDRSEWGIALRKGVEDGLSLCAFHQNLGYGTPKSRAWIQSLINAKRDHDDPVKDKKEEKAIVCEIDIKTDTASASLPLLQSTFSHNQSYFELGRRIVVNGLDKKNARFPVAEFGKRKLIDPEEIENYRKLRILMRNYHEQDDDKQNKPLAFVVFGPPGAGKSSGVQAVAKSIQVDHGSAADDLLVANVSQFQDPKDLAVALHHSRDRSLAGRVPLVFFDEFDAPYQSKRYGWLKYFLAPIQDGEFKDGDATFHLGRAIFVFIGGINHTFDQFDSQSRDPEFVDAKGPDFISRMKGHINIKGPNPVGAEKNWSVNKAPPMYILRRAVQLRFVLEMPKYRRVIQSDGNEEIKIDDNVLRAFLEVGEYKHGARSLEALVEMCDFGGPTEPFSRSALPPPDQLEMHVNALEFRNLLNGKAVDGQPPKG